MESEIALSRGDTWLNEVLVYVCEILASPRTWRAALLHDTEDDLCIPLA